MKTLAFAVLLATALGYGIVSGYGLNIMASAAAALLGSMLYDLAKYVRRRVRSLKAKKAADAIDSALSEALAELAGGPRLDAVLKAWRDGTPTPGCNCERCERIRAEQPAAQN